MAPPTVSVVMAVRNAAAFLPASIESVLAQTLPDFEFIIVDDGSTDDTRRIIERYAHSDRRIVELHQEHKGQAIARNVACRVARGRYIALLDGDDIAVAHRFERQVAFLASHPEVGLLGSAARIIDSQGIDGGVFQHPAGDSEIRQGGNSFVHSAVMMRRAAFESAGGYRTTFIDAEDYDLWLRIAEHYSVANLQEPLILYRVHNGQVSMQRLEQQALSVCGLKAAATLRRKKGTDASISSAPRITRELLKQFDVSDRAIDETILQHYMWQVDSRLRTCAHQSAREILKDVEAFSKRAKIGSEDLARSYMRLARSYRRERHIGRSLAAAFKACVCAPALSSRWLFRLFHRQIT